MSEISPDFSEAYPYLAEEYAREKQHDDSSDLSYVEAMRIIAEANLPHVRVTPTRTGGDTFLEI
jgi:hypothetical protein